MNDDLATMKFEQLENTVNMINKKVENLPDTISEKIDATVNLKIQNAVQQVKIDFYKWLVPIILGLLTNAVGVIFSYIK